MRDYYRQLYANKMDNLEEMDKFLEKHNILRPNQEEIENINRTITSTEIETVIKNLEQTKAQDQMASQVNSIKHLEKSYHLSSQMLPKYSRRRNTPKLILQGYHHPDTKTKDVTKKGKLQVNITNEHR